jgi:SAM-dependent methyltransferase
VRGATGSRKIVRVRVLASLLLVATACARQPPIASSDDERRDEARALEAWQRYRQPDVLIAALGLRPGDRVADVGAGTGLLTWRLAAAVAPAGRVTATDIDPRVLGKLEARGAGVPALKPVVTARQVAPEVPGLEPGAYDLILLSEVDHLLGDRARYLAQLRPALRPGGRIAVTNRRTHREALVAAARASGLAVAREVDALADHFLIFLEGTT